MKQHEEVTFQTLANNEDIQIGYSDNDIVVVDSIQQFAEINTAHVAMNAVVICTNGTYKWNFTRTRWPSYPRTSR